MSYTYNTTPFPRASDFPPVILSYASKSRGGKGKDDMWAIANVLREAGIDSFNGYMVAGGEDWQLEWFGFLPEAKVCILILSPDEYFKSKACVNECWEALKAEGVEILPIQFGLPNMSGRFLGTSPQKIKLVRHFSVPPAAARPSHHPSRRPT